MPPHPPEKQLQQKEEREGKIIVLSLTDVKKKNRNTRLEIIFENGYSQKYCFSILS